MRLPRVRLTVRRMTVAVVVIALVIWILSEAFVKAPARLHVQRLLSHHEVRSGGWRSIADSNRHEPERAKECLRLARWHEARVRELHDGGVPADRRWWDEGDRMTELEQDFFQAIGATGMAPVRYKAL